jgi:hypothetical protein
MDEIDHPNLYKNDWKTPFRQSEFNIQKIEMKFADDDPGMAENIIGSAAPQFDGSHPRSGKYD